MVRRYDEPIEVSVRTSDPDAFIWRGRLYAVRAVHSRWHERRSWWRETGASNTDLAHERRIWRVEAAAGRSGSSGVFDLGLDGRDTRGPWLLMSSED